MKKVKLFVWFVICLLLIQYAPMLLTVPKANASIGPSVIINEVLPKPTSDWNQNGVPGQEPGDEWIELHNVTDNSVDISQWKIDDIISGGSAAYTLPADTILTPYEYRVIYGSQSGVGLNNTSDEVNLINPTDQIIDQTSYSNPISDQSWARIPDSTGAFIFGAPTPGNFNDQTAPSITNAQLFDGLTIGSDADLTNSPDTLSANWSGFEDLESQIAYYKYAIGTGISGAQLTDIVDWASIGNTTQITASGLTLVDNSTYYISVSATNSVNLTSEIVTSDGITVDLSAPDPATNVSATDHPDDNGKALDVDWTASGSADISGYEVGYSETDDTAMAIFVNVGNVTSATIDVLQNNINYYIFVRAIDLAGNQSAVASSTPAAIVATDNIGPAIPVIQKAVLTCSGCQAVITYTFSPDTVQVKALYAYDENFTATVGEVIQQPPTGTITIPGLIPNQTYYFKMQANDESGISTYSDFLKGTPRENSIVTIIGGVGGGVESIENIVKAKTPVIEEKIDTGFSFIPAAQAVTSQAEKVNPAPAEKKGEIKGGTKKKETQENNQTRNIVLVILLVAAAIVAYMGYRAVARSESQGGTTGKQ